MADQPESEKKFDPFEPWRGVRDVYLDAWSKAMIDAVNSDAYAKATGTMLDTYLTASAPFKDTVEKAMLKALEQLSMPSRAEFISLAERLTNIEMRLDDLDAKLDSMQQANAKSSQDLGAKLDRVAATITKSVDELNARLDRMQSLAMKPATAEAVKRHVIPKAQGKEKRPHQSK